MKLIGPSAISRQQSAKASFFKAGFSKLSEAKPLGDELEPRAQASLPAKSKLRTVDFKREDWRNDL